MCGKIDAIIDGGDCEFGVESTVLTLATETPTILRPGAVTKEMIEAVIGKVDVAKAVLEGMENDEIAASPGMKYKHYAPKARVFIVNADKESYEQFVNAKKDCFALCFEDDNVTIPKVTFGKENDDLSQAKELFDALRKLDEMGAKKVYARIPHTTGVGMAVYNRLIRAAAFSIIDLTKPFFIGLTGPSGAGKGFVCEYLTKLGFNIINSDDVVKNIYENNSLLLNKLADVFGNDIIKDSRLDKNKLREIVFSDREKLKILNSIVHPEVIAKCAQLAKPLAVLDAPQLFEAKAQNKCNIIITVMAAKELRATRITERDGISEEKAMERINAQLSEEYYINNADYVIYNNDEDIKTQIDNILEDIL